MYRNLMVVLLTLAVLAMALALPSGCAKKQVVVIDRPTPPGVVPPPQEPVHAEAFRPYAEEPPAAVAPAPAAVSADFSAKYRAAKSPRIAVYLNRQLSEEINEWKSDLRVAIESDRTSVGEENGKKTAESERNVAAASIQYRTDDGRRAPFGPESWEFRMQDAFASQLIASGAKMVDRAMMMRLGAAETASPFGADPKERIVETNALKGKADILAEIVVSNDPDPKHGYLFRVRAVDINTGQVLVSTSSANWPVARRGGVEYVATTQGYEKSPLPKPDQIGAWLAQDLMQGLAGRW